MSNTQGNRYFELSGLIILGLSAFLLVSLPGGCWSDEGESEEGEVDTEANAEPTPPPTMEIVEPEPGDIDTAEVPEEDGESGEGEDDTGNEGNTEPEGEEGENAESEDGTYVVQEGDTLYAIAVDFGVTMEDLMAANGIDDPNTLQVGQELTIP